MNTTDHNETMSKKSFLYQRFMKQIERDDKYHASNPEDGYDPHSTIALLVQLKPGFKRSDPVAILPITHSTSNDRVKKSGELQPQERPYIMLVNPNNDSLGKDVQYIK